VPKIGKQYALGPNKYLPYLEAYARPHGSDAVSVMLMKHLR